AKMTALEMSKDHIHVNVTCPGAPESKIDENTEQQNLEEAREPVEYPEGQIPLTDGKPGTAEQVGELVLFLASDASSHITGTPVWIDGGQSLLQGCREREEEDMLRILADRWWVFLLLG